MLYRAVLIFVLLGMLATAATARQWMIAREATFILVDVAYITGGQVSIRFDDVVGNIRFNDRRPNATTARIVVATATASSGLALLDPVLRGPGFLNAGEYPTIEFEFDNLEQIGPSDAKISGVITIFGISGPMEMKAQVVRYRPDEPDAEDQIISFNLFGEIDRSNFGNTTQSGLIKSVLPIRIYLVLRPLP